MNDAPARYDTIVIGAGQAGPGLATTLAERGERVALVEAGPFGGTCLNSGCRPTKAMRASARAAHVARASGALGVHAQDVRVDLAEVVARKDALIDAWRTSYSETFERDDRIDILHGRGRLVASDGGAHVVSIDGDVRIAAPRVVLNTGARSEPPPVHGLDEVDWYDHRRILGLTELPRHLVVVGGSYIGLELGQIYRRFGAEVTILERHVRVVGREDDVVSDAITGFLRVEGVDIRTGVAVERVTAGRDGGVDVLLDDGATVDASHLLFAAGRVPNSDDLGLDAVGVRTDDRGYIVTDDTFETDVAGIFAVGDVNGRGAFTHTAFQDHEILADHLDGGDRTVAGRTMTYALYTDPPLGRVGLSAAEAERAGVEHEIITFPMAEVTRAVLDAETDGLVRLVVEPGTGQILGAAWLGLHGDEIIQSVSLMMHTGAPLTVLDTWLPIHPTVSEFLPTIAGRRKEA